MILDKPRRRVFLVGVGEKALAASGADHLIFRTSWVFGAHGKNFIKTILRLASSRDELRIVADQFGAPTGASLLADASAHIAARYLRDGRENVPFGLYHLAAGGETSWHGFAQHIVAKAAAANSPPAIDTDDVASGTPVASVPAETVVAPAYDCVP